MEIYTTLDLPALSPHATEFTFYQKGPSTKRSHQSGEVPALTSVTQD